MKYLLDASAVIALLGREPGATRVAEVLDRAVVSSVNFSEIVGFYAKLGSPRVAVEKHLQPLALKIVPVDQEVAFEAGMLLRLFCRLGLSLGDRICLAMARQQSMSVLKADRLWKRVAAEIGVDVELIR